ncbi:outer membrane beta-barrel protein [Cyclobacterium qasimii]|uniref:Outer membrane protein beta-barrel domain-containing protein n=2 Tax=Cyclobacterium qasimii TaxID=1350429 RepID=S7V4Q1_9BACT|nr:outer membrane beta-barrel protein [Cyclobacterium qasimii]EPR65055.1 hypothetical protein ADICYQ_5984 [Cyclobacterium qasimii M12-11B]GEO20838.1 hypothetical protein CQA01_13720 [Cyclobacterium qasimii]
MEPKDSFEKKIKATLEGYTPKYEESAWQDFAPALEALRIPFWKQWYAPYIYATSLFGLAMMLFYFQNNESTSGIQDFKKHDPVTITVRDTLYIYDTLYVYQKQVINSQSLPLSVSEQKTVDDQASLVQSNDYSIHNIPIASNNTNRIKSNPSFDTDAGSNEVEKPLPVIGDASDNERVISSGATEHQRDLGKQKNQQIPANGYSDLSRDSLEKIRKEMFQSDLKQVVGDTSNLSNPILNGKNKKALSVHANANINVLFPFQKEFEYEPSFIPGASVELLWNNKVGLSTGLLWGNLQGEIDDPEDLNRVDLLAYPGMKDNGILPDDIEIRTEQLFIPLMGSYRPVNYGKFDLNIHGGGMFNFTRNQLFSYLFEELPGSPDYSESITVNEWKLSHLMLGIGSSYSISERLKLEVNSTYWLPLNTTGANNTKFHGVNFNLGINYLLWRRKIDL